MQHVAADACSTLLHTFDHLWQQQQQETLLWNNWSYKLNDPKSVDLSYCLWVLGCDNVRAHLGFRPRTSHFIWGYDKKSWDKESRGPSQHKPHELYVQILKSDTNNWSSVKCFTGCGFNNKKAPTRKSQFQGSLKNSQFVLIQEEVKRQKLH